MRPIIPTEVRSPYPLNVLEQVIAGYSRGSSELGIPTANIRVNEILSSLKEGIYFGFAKVVGRPDQESRCVMSDIGNEIHFNYGNSLQPKDTQIFPMVMSIGWNPFYNNTEKAAEVHIIHEFQGTFYGASVRLTILGYLRPELDYTTKDALIEDIKTDIDIATRTLLSTPYKDMARVLEETE